MLRGESTPNVGCDIYMYEGQNEVQLVLVLATVICIPTLLLGKPLHILLTRKKHKRLEPQSVSKYEMHFKFLNNNFILVVTSLVISMIP